MRITRKKLEDIYKKYNHRRFVHPDPLEFLYNYPSERDREVVGFIASSLAYGRVEQILRSVSFVLDKMGKCPYEYIFRCEYKQLMDVFEGFCHRFTKGEELSRLLFGLKALLRKYGTIRECFSSKFRQANSMPEALDLFVHEIYSQMGSHNSKKTLIPDPSKGSACKRLNLYLRWMVRRDSVDPGTWDDIPRSSLIIPLDTHMHRICRLMGFTERGSTGIRTALEITHNFSRISPDDPVKYDFALTRIGIHKRDTLKELLN